MFIQVSLERAAETRMLHQDGRVFMTVGAGSYVADGIIEHGSQRLHVLVGRYTSLTGHVLFEIGMNHDYHRTAAYPFEEFFYTDGISNHAFHVNHNQIIIGHDVKIGEDVIILGGVHIGSGAIVHSGAVVAKDVPPYAIVEGNPGQITGYRYDEKTIKRLLNIQWWNWPEEKIQACEQSLQNNAKVFAEQFSAADNVAQPDEIGQALASLREQGYAIYYLVADFTAHESIWRKVLLDYLSAYTADRPSVLLVEIPKEGFSTERQELLSLLSMYHADAPLVQIYTSENSSFHMLEMADFLITTREEISAAYEDYALRSGVKMVYGVDVRERLFHTPGEYDISIGVMTYRSDYDQLYTTLYSIICQQGCSYEIVIGDDGTQDFRQEEIELWMLRHGFRNYMIVRSPENKGIVQNAMSILHSMRGRYVKMISPGDYLYDDRVLSRMMDFMKTEGWQIAFGRSCFYAKEEDTYRIFDRMQPFQLKSYKERDYDAVKQAYLVCQDYVVGAAFMGERGLVTAYTELIYGRVVYAEDSAYVIMAADDIRFGFWDHNLIWYECGTGISGGKSEQWKARLWHDNLATLAIIAERHTELRDLCHWHAEGRPSNSPYAEIVTSYYAEVDRILETETYLQDVDPRELQKLMERNML